MTDAADTVYYELVTGPEKDEGGHRYYGVCRQFAAAAPWEETPAHDVWRDYVRADWASSEEWESYFPTLELAKGFQRRFAASGFLFGIIAIHPCERAEDVVAVEREEGYLGLDVANTEPNSILVPEVVWRDLRPYEDPLIPLWDIVSRYARSRINDRGLLTRYDDAALLRNVMHALERVDETHQTPRGVRVMAVQGILD